MPLKLFLKNVFLGELSEMSILSFCNTDATPETEQSNFGPFPILFYLETGERETAVLCVNQECPSHLFPCPAHTNTGQNKMFKKKKKKKETSMTTSPYQLSGCSHALALAVVQKSEWKRLG